MNGTSPLPAYSILPLGAIQIGSAVSVGLLGIATLQAWLYYRDYPNDETMTKLLVAVVWCSEFLRSSFLVQTSYHFLVLNWGNPATLEGNYWGLDVLLLMTHIIEVFVHLYFTWRIYKLSRAMRMPYWMLMCLTVTIFNFWTFALGIVSYITAQRSSSWAAYGVGLQHVVTPMVFAASISTDVGIMLALIFLLNWGRSGSPRTESLVNMLIFYIVQAGMLTVAADVAMIVLNQLIDRVGFTYLGIYSIVGNLYANSLLASLNARASLRTHIKSDFNSDPPSMPAPLRNINIRAASGLPSSRLSLAGNGVDTERQTSPVQRRAVSALNQISKSNHDDSDFKSIGTAL
ncbi:hypothetical protein BDY19DRAFT_992892 [Irpex rosettiformis]|uniref:Uncharacterized protein n=1 Tax=Irpex rosettiformis TaxID=378272 RepID=A0ACB8U6D8_9APHY|nr:hypothetical protein BDY19DRAFT_992892 [Irpex rosettiformis]